MEAATELDKSFTQLMDKFEFSKAFDYAWSKVQELNKRIDEEKPWELAKNGKNEKAKAVLQQMVQALLAANAMLSVFLPETSEKIETIFTAEQILPPETPLFPKQ